MYRWTLVLGHKSLLSHPLFVLAPDKIARALGEQSATPSIAAINYTAGRALAIASRKGRVNEPEPTPILDGILRYPRGCVRLPCGIVAPRPRFAAVAPVVTWSSVGGVRR